MSVKAGVVAVSACKCWNYQTLGLSSGEAEKVTIHIQCQQSCLKHQKLLIVVRCLFGRNWRLVQKFVNVNLRFGVWGESSALCSTGRRSDWIDGFEANGWSGLRLQEGDRRLAACINEPGGKADLSGGSSQMIWGVRSVAELEPFLKSSKTAATFMWVIHKQFVPCRCLGASWTRLCRTWYCRWQPVSIWEPSRLQTVDSQASCPVLIQCRQLQ